MKKTLLLSVAALAGALLLVAPSVAQRRANVTDLKGKPMPEFTTTSLTGQTVTKNSLRGKVVVMDFWATWCGPCKAASPKVQKMHEEWKSKGVVVMGMNTFERNDKTGENARKYMKENNYTFKQTINNDAFARRIGVSGVPTFIVMDQRGVVREVSVGFNERAIRAAVEALIK